MINRAGHIEMVNTQAELVFGYSRAELLAQPVEILVPVRFRTHHANLRSTFFGESQSRPMGAGRDLFGRRKDGSEFPIEIGLNPIETEEGPMVLSAIVDISDRKHKEQKIQAALEEKDILLGEIHHRVKNNLQIVHSLLDLQASRIADPTLLDILKDSQNRIRAMALIHQTLYQSKNFAQIDFSDVLNSLVPTLVESYGVNQNKINYTIDVESIFLSINAAIPCGLVVNELISNALKHAFPNGRGGMIAIILRQEGDQVFLSVSDDGIGIPAHLDLEKTATLGLQLITLLSSQLGAELSIQRAGPTRFLLRFPLAR
jgi:PAS domain S-box-containing protein